MNILFRPLERNESATIFHAQLMYKSGETDLTKETVYQNQKYIQILCEVKMLKIKLCLLASHLLNVKGFLKSNGLTFLGFVRHVFINEKPILQVYFFPFIEPLFAGYLDLPLPTRRSLHHVTYVPKYCCSHFPLSI